MILHVKFAGHFWRAMQSRVRLCLHANQIDKEDYLQLGCRCAVLSLPAPSCVHDSLHNRVMWRSIARTERTPFDTTRLFDCLMK